MKTLLLFPATLAAACLCAAQVPPPTILERGPHHRRVQTVREAVQPDGSTLRRTNAYVELATGLHYEQDGQWVESVEQIEPFPDGAVARQGPHQAIFAPNLNSAWPIDVAAPDGNRFRSQVLGLSYFDPATGSNVLIAEVKDSLGQIQRPNQVLYSDAFTEVNADMRYTYTKAGFEQDVILRQSLPSPADYGLDPETARLEIYTEFLDPPVPEQKPRLLSGGVVDTELTFGAARIGRGQAFPLGDPKEAPNGIPVQKLWRRIEGRNWLIESVSYAEIKAQSGALPKGQAALRQAGRNHLASADLRQVPAPRATAKATGPLQMASSVPAAKGVVVDYTILFPISGWTNKADETYYVSSNVVMDYLALEGGSVTKYASETSIEVYGFVDCRTGPYRMAIFTGKDDDSVGCPITGSTGNPFPVYAEPALRLNEYPYDLHHIRIAYASIALELVNGVDGSVSLRHAQLVHGGYGLQLYGQWSLQNVVFQDFSSAFWGTGEVRGQHVTFNQCYSLTSGGTPAVYLTNSLLVNVTRWTNGNTATFYTNAVASASSSSALQTVGAGGNYLAPGSPYRDAGVTTISPALLAELRALTTHPPLVLTGLVSSDLTLSPQAPRDTDQPDLGVHYFPVDFAVSGLTVTNAKLTLTGGVVLATFGNAGLWLRNSSQLISEGSPLARNHIAHYTCIQENTTNWMGEPCEHQALLPQGSTTLPSANFRFTDFEGPSYFGAFWGTVAPYPWSGFRARDCVFRVGSVAFREPTNAVVALTNNLFERLAFCDYGPAGLICQNNLFRGVNCVLSNGSTNVWRLHDNVFEGCTLSSSAVTNSHTAYINMASRLTPTNSTDKVLASLAWQTGPLGGYYQPTNSVLLNAGSTYATNVGLCHYTTTTNQVKEGTGTNDLGLHYVALTNSVACDTDGDGLADYWEDANGNGIADTWEVNWQASDTDGDGISDLLEVLQGRNPLDPDSGPENGAVNLRIFTPLR